MAISIFNTLTLSVRYNVFLEQKNKFKRNKKFRSRVYLPKEGSLQTIFYGYHGNNILGTYELTITRRSSVLFGGVFKKIGMIRYFAEEQHSHVFGNVI